MNERQRKGEFTQKYYDLSAGRVPLFLRAAAVRNPAIRNDIQTLKKDGIELLVVQKLRKTPQYARTRLHEKGNAAEIISKAFRPSSEDESSDVKLVRTLAEEGLRVFSPDASEKDGKYDELFSRLNVAIEPRREKYAIRRFYNDRPAKEIKTLSIIGGASILVAGAATALEAVGLKGWGLLVAQSLDDVGNTAITIAKPDSSKTRWQKTKQYLPIVVPVLVAAGFADNTIIPPLLESPNLSSRLLGGLLFSLAAFGGSAVANTIDAIKTNKMKKNQKEGDIKIKHHPFNLALWAGMGLSTIASEVAASKGILLGHTYSGTLQTVIGQLETITAFGGLYFANSFVAMKDTASDWLTVTKATVKERVIKSKKPKQIFPEEK